MTLEKTMYRLGVSALLSLCLTGGAFAQNETATPAETETPAPSAIEESLDLGEDASAESQVGQPYGKEEVGDFILRCIRSETGEGEPCQLYQLLFDAEDQPVVEFTMFRLPEGGRAVAGATLVAPLETALQKQLTIIVDGGQARRYPFSFCNAIGCYARIGLTAEDVAAFKRGSKATVKIYPIVAPDQEVSLNMSLSGFTAGFDKVSVIEGGQ